MVNPNTQQVFMLADYFGSLANAVGEYIDFNKGNMSVSERNSLYDIEIDLARVGGEINMIGVNLVFEDVKEMLDQLEIITHGVKKAVKKALAVQDAINIASKLVTIGTAIISKNPKAIVQSTIDFGKSLNIKM
ncbi:hypothetical protein [Segetibacter aerophilus]|uniref:Uncharacterized protein n=1 Tax=Segetibacter aerophilus TaxID=670293 RepID=A0A512B7B6_9BACT|nr:hypothetical protein [Segetibacter aerophilus]GEO07846.1 hypothetical protein SAE01_03420 [Segetibacter aerophilus]